jgi:hypothetical protein
MWRLCTSLYDSGVREKSAGVDRTDGSRLGHVGVCGADLFAQIVVSLGFRALVDSAVGMDRAVILVHQVSIRDFVPTRRTRGETLIRLHFESTAYVLLRRFYAI